MYSKPASKATFPFTSRRSWTAVTYDNDGNLTSRTDNTGTTTYDYDQENRLVRVAKPGDTWHYTYDALGNRAAVIHNGVAAHYVHDPIGLVDAIADYDASGNLKTRYIYGLGLVASIDPAGNRGYYSFDALGNTRQITDNSGVVANDYAYDSWGQTLAATEAIPTLNLTLETRPRPPAYLRRLTPRQTCHENRDARTVQGQETKSPEAKETLRGLAWPPKGTPGEPSTQALFAKPAPRLTPVRRFPARDRKISPSVWSVRLRAG